MSYDFELFASRKVKLEPPLTSATSNIRIDGPDQVEEEDLPDNYSGTLGKKRHLFRIHLEGTLNSQDQYVVDLWLGKIVADTNGVLIDLQSETFQTPTKSGHLAAPNRQVEHVSWMTFWFEDGEAFYQHGFEEVLALLVSLMPEAVPTRYGTYEPMQGKIESGDFSGLIATFKAETDVFMKAKSPIGHIFQSTRAKRPLSATTQGTSSAGNFCWAS